MPKVTIYIPTYNNGKYLRKAIESVLAQAYQDFELIIVDDASTDNTSEILEQYRTHPRVHILRNKRNIGFIRSAIKAIKMAKGEYICRLDGDDWLDENALLIMVNILERHPETMLVYPDYFYVNERGEILEYFRKKKMGSEMKLLDLPPNSGGVIMRKSFYQKIGGYRDDIRAQDKYDLWLKTIKKVNPANIYTINLPLYYYRHHATNISNEPKAILQARKYIKRKFLEEIERKKYPKVLGIIPARAYSHVYPDLPVKKLAGKPLLAYPIETLKKAKGVEKVIFTSEEKKFLDVAKRYEADTLLRPKSFGKQAAPIQDTLLYVLKELKKKKYLADEIALLYLTSPLVGPENIEEAINTLLIFEADSVLSVKEDKKFHYHHGMYGLEPLYEKRLLKHEKDLLFEETGGLIVTKRKCISKKGILGKKISHILLTEDEAVDIDNKFQFWLAEQILKNKRRYEV